ncbi:UDP-4-amino-4,6-dideoxy-N-acetyl-beta-L-altrosamine transaminase [Candidatus Pseudothioglobus singularis]|nr:UDP-4-amino-4,6-dideoxy-N-acetyl-beta-L-altrosamine transaminase [Candidatus Pseudothioglobus singularis]
MKVIPYGKQDINQTDIDSVVSVLKSDFLTQGPQVPLFEKTVSEYCGVKYGVAVSNATAALHIACLALNLGPGDWLWTSPITFVATANCALYCGAQVDFVDIDPRTYNISVESLGNKLAQAKKDGKLPKIVAAVHLCGQSCDMAAIQVLSKQYGFKIIEDASHALGGKYKNKTIGSCCYSDITVFSFHPVKIITTGEGGMVLTNNQELADLMQRYRSHGITNDASNMQPRSNDEIWNYQQISLGFNYRMTDIQAALGVSQMTHLDKFITKRQQIAKRYNIELAELALQTPYQNSDSYSSYHLYPIRIKLVQGKQNQRQFYDALQLAGINVNLHYIPVYRQPYYEKMGYKVGYCPEAEQYHKEAISIPMYPSMSEVQQNYVVKTIKNLIL